MTQAEREYLAAKEAYRRAPAGHRQRAWRRLYRAHIAWLKASVGKAA